MIYIYIALFLCSYITHSFLFSSTTLLRRYSGLNRHSLHKQQESLIKLSTDEFNVNQYCRLPSIINSDEEEEDDVDNEDEEKSQTAPVIIEDNNIVDISPLKEGINFTSPLNGSDVRVGIVATRWNADIISGLYKGVNESLLAAGVKPSNIFTTYVPGAFELPLTAKFLIASKRFDVIICLGCVIKGDTMHFEYICQAASTGIMQVSLETLVPVIFGVLTVLDKEQAIVRSVGDKNEGLSWGKTAVEMALARMSALGIGRSLTNKKDDANAFVTFSGALNETTKESSDKPKPKRIGF